MTDEVKPLRNMERLGDEEKLGFDESHATTFDMKVHEEEIRTSISPEEDGRIPLKLTRSTRLALSLWGEHGLSFGASFRGHHQSWVVLL
ncbi:unnamed protein product [Protopolystoma xenopodis]|uniref:Uncharacterized protein n=1 Tax=Protopolystoma xenopodis TaxID=117903 RepID=A0A3S5APJ8_9PLAT|nr:unnamed protein product [Protopolystoma xenopodis]